MGRKQTASLKSKASTSPRRASSSAAVEVELSADVSDDDLRDLQELVAGHRSRDLRASWRLGRLAGRVLGHTQRAPASRTAIAELAEKIGLIPEHDAARSENRPDESSLRQMMKFSRVAREKQVQALQRKRIPWRGIVYWIGVEEPKHRSQLYKEMIKSLANSTEIRRYIAKRFRKPAPPRRHADLAVMCTAAQEASETLVATLQNLNERLDERSRESAKGKARRLRATQKRRLEAALREAAKLVRVTRSRLKVPA